MCCIMKISFRVTQNKQEDHMQPALNQEWLLERIPATDNYRETFYKLHIVSRIFRLHFHDF